MKHKPKPHKPAMPTGRKHGVQMAAARSGMPAPKKAEAGRMRGKMTKQDYPDSGD